MIVGDPTREGPYTIRLIVVSGVWYFGYGSVADAAAEKALPPGSFYAEPSGVAHFAETKTDSVVVYITENGPTDTVYVKPKTLRAAPNCVRCSQLEIGALARGVPK